MSSGNEYFTSTGDTAGDWPSLKYYYQNGYLIEQGYYIKPEESVTKHNNKIIEIIDNLLCSLEHCIDIKRFKEISDQLIMLKQYNQYNYNWIDAGNVSIKYDFETVPEPIKEKIKLEEDLFEL